MGLQSYEADTGGVINDRWHNCQLLARACGVMKNEMTIEEPVTAMTHAVESDVPMMSTMCSCQH